MQFLRKFFIQPYHGGEKRAVSRVEYSGHSEQDRGKEEGQADLPRHLPAQEVELHRAGVHQRVETLQSQTIKYVHAVGKIRLQVEYGGHSAQDRGKEKGQADLPRHLPTQEVELHRAGVHQRVETLQNQTIRHCCGSGSGINNPDHISESLKTIFLVKILQFFDADPGSGMEKILFRLSGESKSRRNQTIRYSTVHT
jgi:hypothetical protein